MMVHENGSEKKKNEQKTNMPFHAASRSTMAVHENNSARKQKVKQNKQILVLITDGC